MCPDHSCGSFGIDNSHTAHPALFVAPVDSAAAFAVGAVGTVGAAAGMQLDVSPCRIVEPDAWLWRFGYQANDLPSLIHLQLGYV